MLSRTETMPRLISSATALCCSAAVAICWFMPLMRSIMATMRATASPASDTPDTDCELELWQRSM